MKSISLPAACINLKLFQNIYFLEIRKKIFKLLTVFDYVLLTKHIWILWKSS